MSMLPQLKASSKRDVLQKKKPDEKPCTDKTEHNFSQKGNSDD